MGFTVAEGPEVETDWYNFEALNIPPTTRPAACGTRSTSTSATPGHDAAAHPHLAGADPRDAAAAAADLHGHARPGVPPRHRRRHPHAGVPPDRGPGRRPGHHASPTWPAPSRRSPRPTSASDFTSRLRPSYFPFTEPSAEFDIRRPDGTLARARRLRHGPPQRAARRAASTPRSGAASPSASASTGWPRHAPRRRRPPRACSPTTSASWSSSEVGPHEGPPAPGSASSRRSSDDPDALGDAMSDLGMAVEEIEPHRRRASTASSWPGCWRPAPAPRRRPDPAGRRRRRRRRGRSRSAAAPSTWRSATSCRWPRSARSCPTAWRSSGASCGASGRTGCSARPPSSGSATTTAASSILPAGLALGTGLREALGIEPDVLFDLEINPNRPDAMSVAGVARDLAARLGVPFAAARAGGRRGRRRARRRACAVEIAAPDLCGRFTARVLAGRGRRPVDPPGSPSGSACSACARSTTWSTSPTT